MARILTLRPKVPAGLDSRTLAVRVEIDHERDGAWHGFVVGASRSLVEFRYEDWVIVVGVDLNTERGLAEIAADLSIATVQRSVSGLVKGATELAALSGAQLAALTLCIPVVAYALRSIPPSSEEHGRARAAAAAILELTGIDPRTEG